MRLFKVKRADAFDPGLAYRTLKKIRVRGQMTIVWVEDLMHDYVWPVKPSRMNSGRQIYGDKRAMELQRVFGDFGSIARNGIYWFIKGRASSTVQSIGFCDTWKSNMLVHSGS